MALNFNLTEKNSRFDSIPEEFDGVLESPSLAVCCSFSRRGGLLAVGCNDGRLAIWDLLTRSITKTILMNETKAVCSVCWSRKCFKLLTTSLDNCVCVWDVLSGKSVIKFRFPSPVLKSQFHPRDDKFILVSPLKYPSILIYYDETTNITVYRVLPIDHEEKDFAVISTFDKRGKYMYSGNSRGRITIIKCPDILASDTKFEIISSFSLQSSGCLLPAVREIEFPLRNKNFFLVNSTDRAIRLFECKSALEAGINGTCVELRKFQDLVNKAMWRRCCFSGDPDATYVCAGSARQHALHIWDANDGTIKKMLNGSKGEILLDVQWHPLRPLVTSISSGLISLWSRPQIENWSAFAPDFKELEENIEYEERESEFDFKDEDNPSLRNPLAKDDDDDTEMVDVLETKPEDELLSSDEEGSEIVSPLDFIPLDNIQESIEDELTLHQNSGDIIPSVQPVDDGKYVVIELENAPIDEVHPLSSGSTKRIKFNDHLINPARKVLKTKSG